MEKELCRLRDIYRTLQEFEQRFEKSYNLCLNEGMLLCVLQKKERALSGELAQELGLTCSNTSKVIKSLEKKGFIKRELGECDKRNMYFRLSEDGVKILKEIKCSKIELPNVTLN